MVSEYYRYLVLSNNIDKKSFVLHLSEKSTDSLRNALIDQQTNYVTKYSSSFGTS